LGINLRNDAEPDKALVGASSLSSRALVGRVLLSKRYRDRTGLVGAIAYYLFSNNTWLIL